MSSSSSKRKEYPAGPVLSKQGNTTTTGKGGQNSASPKPVPAEEKQKILALTDKLQKILTDGKNIQKATQVLAEWVNGPKKKSKK